MLARTGNVRVAAPARAIAVRPVVAARAQVVVKALEAPAPVVAAQSAATDGEQARAVLRYIRGSPNKVRRVLDTIRGRTYEDALGMLEFMPYRCAALSCTLLAVVGARPRSTAQGLYAAICQDLLSISCPGVLGLGRVVHGVFGSCDVSCLLAP